jgi:hypothetical protein
VTRQRPPRDEITKHEEAYVGKTARVEVPLRSVTALRRVADELRGLANRLEFLGHEKTDRPSEVLLEARSLVRQCNHKMAAIRGPGRPRKQVWLDPTKPARLLPRSRKPCADHKM